VLQFKPGLLVDRGYCDEALTRFESALQSVRDAGGASGRTGPDV